MSENEQNKGRILYRINAETTLSEFEAMIDEILVPNDHKLFGDKAKDLVIQSILYVVPFAPWPATFDSEAYAFVVDDAISKEGLEVDPDRIDRLLRIAMEQGIVDIDTNARLFVTKRAQEKLIPILDLYEET